MEGNVRDIRSEYMYNLFSLIHLLSFYRFSVWMQEIATRRWTILVFLFLVFCVWLAYVHWGKDKVGWERKHRYYHSFLKNKLSGKNTLLWKIEPFKKDLEWYVKGESRLVVRYIVWIYEKYIVMKDNNILKRLRVACQRRI